MPEGLLQNVTFKTDTNAKISRNTPLIIVTSYPILTFTRN
jgi:hypothetical protein